MDTRDFGKTGMRFSAVGLGTWEMEKDRRASIAALQRGIAEGANHIDTAEFYGSGRAERVVGEALAGRRREVFIVSKVMPSHASYRGTIEACERSLKNLKTGWLDCYLLHWREGSRLEETFRAFERLLKDGKIRSFGVSNFDVKDMEEAERIAGPGRIACDQVLYHIKERAIEFELLPWCAERGVSLVAYSPLAQGRLPGNAVLGRVAQDHGATAAQVMLAFLLENKNVIAIPKAADAVHAGENVKAGSLALTEDQIRALDAAFPARRRRSLAML